MSNNQPSSLFGGATGQSSTGNLFSKPAGTAGTGNSGLFSGSTIFGSGNQQAGSSAPPAGTQTGSQPSSLFGGTKPSGAPTGTDANKPASSLFGGSSGTSNLFGGANKPATGNPATNQSFQAGTAPGNLFGGAQAGSGQQPQATGQASGTGQPSSLFGGSKPVGQQGTSQPSSLFGGASQPSAGTAAAGNLFGKPSAQTAAAPGTGTGTGTGAQQPQAGTAPQQGSGPSGLFGNQASAGTQPQAGQPQSSQASNLFGGGQPKPAEQKPGLFQTGAPAQGQGAPAQGQGAPAQPAAAKPTTGLFGNASTNQPTGQPAAPSGQTQGQSGSSLFPQAGAGQTPSTTAAPSTGSGSGLFGGNQPKPAASATPSTGTGTGLFAGNAAASGTQAGTGAPAAGTTGTAAGTGAPAAGAGGLFGGTQAKPGEVAAKKPEDIDMGMRQNMTVEELLRSWKKDLDSQVQNFQGLTKFLTQHELDAYKNLEMGEQLVETLNEMEKEYRAIEFSLGGIDKGQDNLYQKLDIIEQELSNYLYPEQSRPMPESSMSRIDLVNMAKRMNGDIFQIEEEMLNLVQEMNQPVDEKDPTQLSENVLNNYFDALQFIETETLKSMNKLSKIESILSNQ